jgi:hypothetical protein
MTHNYKVLKLRSGDSIIGELIENSKYNISVNRPMEIKYMHFIDSIGRKHETLILVDWLKSTTVNTIKLEKNFILGIFVPSPDIVQSYDHQKKLDDHGGKIPTKNLFNMNSNQGLEGLINKMEESFKNIDIDRLEELIKEQVEEGAEEFIEEIIENSMRQEKIIDETSDPTFGDSYPDWSPDPEDYLS